MGKSRGSKSAGKAGVAPTPAAPPAPGGGGAAAAANPPARPAPPRRRRVPSAGACVFGCALLLVLGPLFFFFIPHMVPPVDSDPARTMMGGRAQTDGVHALWTELQRHKLDFCTEAGAPDTLRCMWSVWELTWALLRAPSLVDFYVAMPLATWNRLAAAGQLPLQDKGIVPVSPLYVDKRWLEGAVSETGQTRAQIAHRVLEAVNLSSARVRPVGTRNTFTKSEFGCLSRQVEAIPCLEEYDRVFGAPRGPVLGGDLVPCGERLGSADLGRLRAHVAGPAAFGSRRPKAFYAFGIQAAVDLLANLPAGLPNDVPLTIALIPADDHGRRWYARTRGREYCTEARFRKHYEALFTYFAWLTRPDPQFRLPRPSGQSEV
eukprot:TRINITY_DN1758_c2_g1_i1.p1 TRINITY_DN1758_c2_g1~~TRINITY_DN1758_c2_g1_i1.p1  ORF type:complete len:376 (+),score=85.26 TRINITY_DN1758_c2_g1_i1:75-1202(+)